MPLLSAFTPFGLLEFSGEPSIAERINDALWANVNGGRENFAQDGHMAAKMYADSMGLAWLLQATRRAEANLDPAQAYDLLPALEESYGLVVSETATLADRRAALAVAERIGAGGNVANLTQALADLLGSAFVQLRIPTYAESSVYPASPGNGPGLFGAPSMARVMGKTTTALSTGLDGTTPHVIGYTDISGSAPSSLERVQKGMSLVVEPEHPDLAERVNVTTATVTGSATFTATFTKPHPAGVEFVAMPWPYWFSTKHHYLVEVTTSAAQDPESRRKIHDLMRRMVRGVSTWAICGSAGPFTIGSSTLGIIGVTPIGSI
jgi:hypothetical protein